MKRLALLFISVWVLSTLSAQDKVITPPLGLTFGMNESEFETAMARYGTPDSTTIEDFGEQVSFTDVKIGNTTADYFLGNFVDGKLFEAAVVYFVDDDKLQDKYDELCKIITSKYGTGESTRKFLFPFEDDEATFVDAVKGGYTEIMTLWQITNYIAISITYTPAVCLLYQSAELKEIADKKIEQKNAEQF